jgi:hypothetical protein
MSTKSVLLALAAITVLGGMAMAQYSDSLSMVNMSVLPNPVVAGGNATIRFQLYNAYESWLYGTSIQPSGSYPLLNVSPMGSYVIGRMDPGVNGRYYDYTIRIPNTTPSGTYTMDFTAKYFVYAAAGTEVASSSMPVSFYVYNKPAITVTASAAGSGSAVLYLGRNQTIDIVVQNTGYGTARNVRVAVSSGSGLSILSPVRSFFISNLTWGSSVTEPLTVSANNASGASIIASVTYYSTTLQQKFSSVQSMNLSVAPSAQFAIGSAGQGLHVGGTDVPVHFVITNNGTTSARELQLSLQSAYPITPVASSVYLPDLAPGQSANVTFLVSVDSAGVPSNYPVTLFEQWKQPDGATNQQFTGSSNYFVQVVSATGGASNQEIEAAAAAILIAAFAAYSIRKRRKVKSAPVQKKR